MERVTADEASEDPANVPDAPSLATGRAKGAALIPSVEGGSAGFGDKSPESVREDLTEWQENIRRLAQEFADQRDDIVENEQP
jgi:hypothetical protein